jgi:O-acetyl-ADP-ribose deacetylase (regulator of RNase III)
MITAIKADITTLAVDAIVNAANSSLLGGGGVDGAIHRAAGPGLVHECRLLGGCRTGEARMTRGYDLPARHVFHTVGPVWQDGQRDEPALLANCYWKSLQLAEKLDLQSIAFPAISCGVFGYPLHQAAQIAATETVAWQRSHREPRRIILVAYNSATFKAYQSALAAQGQPFEATPTAFLPTLEMSLPPAALG